MHIITLSFDDGFKKSNLKIAEIYEKHGLAACFNIIASGHVGDFVSPDVYQNEIEKGDFELWNEFQSRGHEIMPHSWKHSRLPDLPGEEAIELMERCLATFETELAGFKRETSVFNFPYNFSTPELEAWLTTQVRAYRTRVAGIQQGINPLPSPDLVALGTCGFGPGNCEEHLDQTIEALLSKPEGWLIYNTHGLNGEGWGPIGADYLDRLLDRLLKIDSVKVMPAAKALMDRS
ncbi:MAG: polysaccharide deacetylase family protein [Planctomycetota bacterium]|nr:polysaccharide deacetylase family protein [Planctomycetota bacterium]MDA1138077.1 polysaccharide deacetylase family protein [Planctomycetota bacterium]